jgi:hypothetical protein
MPVLERPTESTVELIPSFKRLNAVQDRFAIDERTVTLGTDQRWRWRFRGARPETACFHDQCVLSRQSRFSRFRGLHRPNVAAGETLKRVDAVGRARKFQPTRMGLAALLAGHIGSRLHRLASGGRRRTSFNTASGGVGLTRTASAPAARARSKSASRVSVVTTRIGTVRVVSSRRSTSQSAYPSTIGRRVSVITSVAWATVVS